MRPWYTLHKNIPQSTKSLKALNTTTLIAKQLEPCPKPPALFIKDLKRIEPEEDRNVMPMTYGTWTSPKDLFSVNLLRLLNFPAKLKPTKAPLLPMAGRFLPRRVPLSQLNAWGSGVWVNATASSECEVSRLRL